MTQLLHISSIFAMLIPNRISNDFQIWAFGELLPAGRAWLHVGPAFGAPHCSLAFFVSNGYGSQLWVPGLLMLTCLCFLWTIDFAWSCHSCSVILSIMANVILGVQTAKLEPRTSATLGGVSWRHCQTWHLRKMRTANASGSRNLPGTVLTRPQLFVTLWMI